MKLEDMWLQVILWEINLVYKPEFAISKKTLTEIYDGTFQCVVADTQERLESVIQLAGLATKYASEHAELIARVRQEYLALAK